MPITCFFPFFIEQYHLKSTAFFFSKLLPFHNKEGRLGAKKKTTEKAPAMITYLMIYPNPTKPHIAPKDSYGEGGKRETKRPVMTRYLPASEKTGTLPVLDRRKYRRFVPASEK